MAIAREGHYQAPSGGLVDLRDALAAAIAGTVSVPPQDRLAPPAVTAGHRTRIHVSNETTLAAARRLTAAGANPVALNFASALNPGGGFLSGARAQEESLCRSSGLHACLVGQPMYAHHIATDDPMYTSWLLYSPGVPVFRDDDGVLQESSWSCAFITAAAPMVKTLRARDPGRLPELAAVMTERVDRVPAIAAQYGHPSIILGAWGCGAFGGDTDMVAEIFHAALHGPYRGAFATVVFAVLDATPEQRFIAPFERRFA